MGHGTGPRDTHTHTRARVRAHARTLARRHTGMQACRHSGTQARKHAGTQACSPARTHIHVASSVSHPNGSGLYIGACRTAHWATLAWNPRLPHRSGKVPGPTRQSSRENLHRQGTGIRRPLQASSVRYDNASSIQHQSSPITSWPAAMFRCSNGPKAWDLRSDSILASNDVQTFSWVQGIGP